LDRGRLLELAPPDPQACVETAIRRGAPPDPEQLAHFEAQCARGDAAACSILGVMHERGEDNARAWLLFGGACRSGNARACANLAELLERGHPSGTSQVVLLYDHACRHDVPQACTKLGRIHETGDRRRAVELYEIACSLGDASDRLHAQRRESRAY
jgi:TPR repeat protein